METDKELTQIRKWEEEEIRQYFNYFICSNISTEMKGIYFKKLITHLAVKTTMYKIKKY